MRGKPEYSHLPIIKLLCTIGKKEGARCDPHTNGLFSQFQFPIVLFYGRVPLGYFLFYSRKTTLCLCVFYSLTYFSGL